MKTVKLASTGYLDHLPTAGQRARPGVPRPGARSEGDGAGAPERHRGPVRRQVLRARRPGHPTAAPRRLVPGRDRRLVLGRPQHQGADRPRRPLARGARAQPRTIHPRPGYRAGLDAEHGVTIDLDRRWRRSWPSSRGTRSRTPLEAHRDHRRGPRHRPRQDQGTARPRRGDAAATSRTIPVYYAGPAKTPEGMPSGSFGPTTAGRMDSYVDLFQSHGGSLVMIAKGNRSKAVTDACKNARRLLPRLDRRPRRAPGPGEHQEGRAARVPRAGHGGRLQDRRRRLPGVHPGRRQGERVLLAASGGRPEGE